MAAVIPIPTTYRLASWLDREAMRIHAGVKNATVESVANSAYRAARSRGCDAAAAATDAQRVIAYLETRIGQLDDLMSHRLPFDLARAQHG